MFSSVSVCCVLRHVCFRHDFWIGIWPGRRGRRPSRGMFCWGSRRGNVSWIWLEALALALPSRRSTRTIACLLYLCTLKPHVRRPTNGCRDVSRWPRWRQQRRTGHYLGVRWGHSGPLPLTVTLSCPSGSRCGLKHLTSPVLFCDACSFPAKK